MGVVDRPAGRGGAARRRAYLPAGTSGRRRSVPGPRACCYLPDRGRVSGSGSPARPCTVHTVTAPSARSARRSASSHLVSLGFSVVPVQSTTYLMRCSSVAGTAPPPCSIGWIRLDAVFQILQCSRCSASLRYLSGLLARGCSWPVAQRSPQDTRTGVGAAAGGPVEGQPPTLWSVNKGPLIFLKSLATCSSGWVRARAEG